MPTTIRDSGERQRERDCHRGLCSRRTDQNWKAGIGMDGGSSSQIVSLSITIHNSQAPARQSLAYRTLCN